MNRSFRQPGHPVTVITARRDMHAPKKPPSDAGTKRRRGERTSGLSLVRSAFTLIELIVVTILLAILAGFMAPRLLNTQKRQADFEAAEVTRLLGVAARRAALSNEIVAVEYNAQGPSLSLVVLRDIDTGRGTRRTWVQDSLVPPVFFQTATVIRASADGQALAGSAGNWWVDFNPSEPRPALWLLVGDPRGDATTQWQVELLPEETTASRRSMSEPSRASVAGAVRVDLDAANQGERAW